MTNPQTRACSNHRPKLTATGADLIDLRSHTSSSADRPIYLHCLTIVVCSFEDQRMHSKRHSVRTSVASHRRLRMVGPR